MCVTVFSHTPRAGERHEQGARLRLVAPLGGAPRVTKRSFCDTGARATLRALVLAGGVATLYCELTGTLATLWRVCPCLWRLVNQREPRIIGPASQQRVRPARTADTRPDLATSARRLVPQTAPCRAYLSIPRVSPRRLPRRSSAFHHSPARRSRRSSPTASRCAAKVRASSCTLSI